LSQVAQVTLLYFAWVREAIGVSEEQVDLPATLVTAGDVARWLFARSPGHAQAFADLTRLRCAADQAMLAMEAPLGHVAELAFFPPVTGG
jgi:sulfur-carrier protein